MRVTYDDTFLDRLYRRLVFIKSASPNGARKFRKQLFAEIQRFAKKPYQCRKSIYFEDDKIRDLVFKGHTITFLIEEKSIIVFGFKYYQNQPVDK